MAAQSDHCWNCGHDLTCDQASCTECGAVQVVRFPGTQRDYRRPERAIALSIFAALAAISALFCIAAAVGPQRAGPPLHFGPALALGVVLAVGAPAAATLAARTLRSRPALVVAIAAYVPAAILAITAFWLILQL